MALNFRGGPPKPPAAKPTDPLKIFAARPAIPSQINDLWQGQAEALSRWYAATENDILIALNTGAGKSVVGTLICQSMLNAGVGNVVYVCANNDLVAQTAKEAEKLSLSYSTKTAGDYSNDKYETGSGFLITSYQTLINSRTSLRNSLAPNGVVFDDAHVGEPIMRGQFTLSLDARKHADIYGPVLEAIRATLAPSDLQRMNFVLGSRGQGDMFLCPPETGNKVGDLLTSLQARFNAEGYGDVLFPYLYLATHWHACALVVTTSQIEISPPFLPTRTLPVFRDASVKRVYLSATLKAESEFVRAYGKLPDLRIEPEVDAGNGERTIISSRQLKDADILPTWAERKRRSSKILVAVPSKSRAATWSGVGTPPDRSSFIHELNAFRENPTGGFVLAGRFDGIDLPDTVCRLMVISGLPTGGSDLEKFLWQRLEMQNALAAKVATRVTQLFGRIIRGRNDYGFFIIQGRDLTNWLGRDRNLSLLPELLQKQIKLGQHLQDDFDLSNLEEVDGFLDQVYGRDPDWLGYYRQFLDTYPLDDSEVAKQKAQEHSQALAAVAEMKAAEALWQRRYPEAIGLLENAAASISETDAKLAGWLYLWTGASYSLAGNDLAARQTYAIARSKLNLEMDLPLDKQTAPIAAYAPASAVEGAVVDRLVESPREFSRARDKIVRHVNEGIGTQISPNITEETYRSVGSYLGFTSTRPDNDEGAGPDVLWLDKIAKKAISFELKTDKAAGSTLNKKDIGQSHNHIQWFADSFADYELTQHFFVGEDLHITASASPDPAWALSEPHEITNIIAVFTEELARMRGASQEAMERALQDGSEQHRWTAETIAAKLKTRGFEEI